MLKNIKGLKYPDEFLVRFFFKYGLDKIKNGTVIEYGSASGCNLQLFAEYDFKMVGVDLNEDYTNWANENFKLLNRNNYKFICDDMTNHVSNDDHKYDVLLIPSSVYYLPKKTGIDFLKSATKHFKKGSYFFLRIRNYDDYRYQNGTIADEFGTCKINFSETGEEGATISFYTSKELQDILMKIWQPSEIKTINVTFENYQSNTKIYNSDFIIYGKI